MYVKRILNVVNVSMILQKRLLIAKKNKPTNTKKESDDKLSTLTGTTDHNYAGNFLVGCFLHVICYYKVSKKSVITAVMVILRQNYYILQK